ELGEIENRVREYNGVEEAVVTARTDKTGDKYLCAYITVTGTAEGTPTPPGHLEKRAPAAEELKIYLSDYLPEYMIPPHFIVIDRIPLNPNGKVNLKALPLPEQSEIDTAYTAPRNHEEETLAEIWSEVLGIEKESIGIDADFFRIGGHSLRAAIMSSKIHKALNVTIALTEIFKTPTIRGLAENIKQRTRDKYTAIEPVEKKHYYPLSPAQMRMFILQQMELESTAYNMPHTIPLPGEIDKHKLEQTFKKLVQRHESLRTTFHIVNNNPVQKIHAPIEVFNISYYAPDNNGDGNTRAGLPTANVKTVIAQFVKPFDLSMVPLLRVGLIKTKERHILIVDMHHIVSDGLSHKILEKDYISLYQGETLPPLTLQYKDYTIWQNRAKQQENLKKQKRYWLKQFEKEMTVTNLPTDFERPILQDFAGSMIPFTVAGENAAKLKDLVLHEKVTLYILLLAVFYTFLARISGNEDVVVGTPVAGRRHEDLRQIIGIFVNTLALRNYPGGEKSFADFLKKVKENTLEALENQDYPLEELVEKVEAVRDTSRQPLFDTMFTLESMETTQDDIPEPGTAVQTSPKTADPGYEHNIAKFDLTLSATDTGHTVLFGIEYSTTLFKEKTIRKFCDYLKNIIAAVLESTETRLEEIEILTAEEKKKVLYDFNDTASNYPRTKTFPQNFTQQVEKTPHRTAVVSNLSNRQAALGPAEPVSVTYGELNKKSDMIAKKLREIGAGPGNIVCIITERSLEMMIGIFGIWKAGCAYLPILPTTPPQRKEYILEDSGVTIILTTSKHGQPIGTGKKIIYLDKPTQTSENSPKTKKIKERKSENKETPPTPSNLAYIIYTSGTTGKPKGVPVAHKALCNRIHWLQREYGFDNKDVILQKTPFIFDVSVCELTRWVLSGSKICILPEGNERDPERLISTIAKNMVTVIEFLPAMLSVFLEYLDEHGLSKKTSHLKWIFVGAETLETRVVKKFKNTFTQYNTKLINAYGPTEAAVDVTHFDCTGTDEKMEKIPIGRPMANVRIYILDKYKRLQPVGVAGELCVSGDSLAEGYLNRPALTAEKFTPGPNESKETMYTTGDMARWKNDGNIEFLGRFDFQVKIRGHRVELEEIESQLLKRDDIKNAAVTWNQQDQHSYICAYIIANNDDASRPELLKEYLAGYLPEYMIPSYFIRLKRIPLTPNGKIDRKALPLPEIKATKNYVPPDGHLEEKLVEIWSALLAIKKSIIGIHDNFFQLGGHSLKATMLASRIHKETEVKLPLTEIFKTPNIRGIAQYIKKNAKEKYTGIQAVEKKDCYPLSSAQMRLYILQQMEPENTAYNMPQIFKTEEPDRKKLQSTFKQLILRHESFRTTVTMVNGSPVQKIYKNVEFEIEYYEVNNKTGTGSELDIIDAFIRPFDLSQAPLLRAGLIKKTDAPLDYPKTQSPPTLQPKHPEYILLVDMHHIISDGTSHNIVEEDFMALYKGAILPPLNINYKDYAHWQNNQRETGSLKSQESFWLNRFKGEIPVLELPLDFARSKVQGFEGGTVRFILSPQQTLHLKETALQENATLYMVLLALYNVLLSKLTGSEDIVIGTPIAGRRHADLEKIIGMFVNTIALRNYPKGANTFRGFLKDTGKYTLEAYDNQDYQFEDLVDKVAVNRDIARNPLFDVMFTL
ncbi:MAG: amino acid adenylation domain-containing protein, partial [bacterium]|nr:amino acid adenylation domain-containing protein [bacterium]